MAARSVVMKRKAYLSQFATTKPTALTLESSNGVSWARSRLLGKGGFGSVFLAKKKTTTFTINSEQKKKKKPFLPPQVAVKSAMFDKASSLMHENEILCDLKASPYVLKCYGDEVTELIGGQKVYNLLLEYCSGLTLQHHIIRAGRDGLPESHVKCYALDIARGLNHVHSCGYVHCDIKPGNILLVQDEKRTPVGFRAKIADFGLALKEDQAWDSGDWRGTYRYMSPEIVRDKEVGYAGDIWALGCTVVEMLSGKPCWPPEVEVDSLLQIIGYSNSLPRFPSGISDEALDFLCKCFCRSSLHRWSAEKLLEHPFLSGMD
ncbi:hypothetical protein Tsubulata_000058 [Turnera subulata]|uniref:Protein kinase domain-containing protein n=1 Tax=Turnera subulata TaxID=218843 RepID=A0A9Q0FJ95_9ROSI|nr:hypothetical protein Tsubulata_000058 [Turnera subulata]